MFFRLVKHNLPPDERCGVRLRREGPRRGWVYDGKPAGVVWSLKVVIGPVTGVERKGAGTSPQGKKWWLIELLVKLVATDTQISIGPADEDFCKGVVKVGE